MGRPLNLQNFSKAFKNFDSLPGLPAHAMHHGVQASQGPRSFSGKRGQEMAGVFRATHGFAQRLSLKPGEWISFSRGKAVFSRVGGGGRSS